MQINRHNKACKILNEIDGNRSNYLIIHYSCESFYNITDGKTPRVTSIAIRSFDTGQTESFSIHKTAEKKHIDFAQIKEKYDELESAMLSDFFEFVKENKTRVWLHWNMRDINYGFKAIEHRYEVLDGVPYVLPDTSKIDLARLLIEKYGVTYASNPRLQTLIDLNNIKPLNFLSGKDEASAFENKEYIKLHQSTLRKVDVIANILERAIDNSLNTLATWKSEYGISAQGIYDFIKNCWWLQLIIWLFTLILGAWLGRIFSK